MLIYLNTGSSGSFSLNTSDVTPYYKARILLAIRGYYD